MKTLFLFLASWLVGLLSYVGALYLFFGQSIGGSDFRFVLLWSFGVFAFCFVILYMPVLLMLRNLLHGVRPAWPFPLVAILLGIVPTAIIVAIWGGNFHSLVRPEALLFHCLFAAAGLAVGLGFSIINRRAKLPS